ncbi:ATP-binding protein [Candidatus Bathyarchaeota archaeon]|nr:ATP-binding protein [Candidatus Bathyarchaeota archaeon]
MTTVYAEEEQRPIYPFTAIVAQNDLKTAIILNAIDPNIGGVLFTGPKGTGKSSIVRAAAEILPEVEAVEDCTFHCSPSDPTNMCEACHTRYMRGEAPPKKKKRMRVMTLPIGASEDRVIGSLDVEKAILEGTKILQPGLLAEANQSILYIDEVNLLPDHIVDMILDASASGWNTIEREGISVSHPSRFILVGTMNPEEGELRPQILDRFGLHAKADSLSNLKERIEVIRRNEDFSGDPESFRSKYEPEQEELRRRIISARELLPKVSVSESIMESVAKICTSLKVDGYRPDIVIIRAAKALAAFNGRNVVQADDVIMSSEFALGHRTRREGQVTPPTFKEIYEALEDTVVGKEVLASKPLYFRLSRRVDKLRKTRIGHRLFSIIIFFLFPLALFACFFITFNILSQFFILQVALDGLKEKVFVAGAIASLTFFLLILPRKPKKIAVKSVLDLAKITMDQKFGDYVVKVERGNSDNDAVYDVNLNSVQGASLNEGEKVFQNPLQQPQPIEQPTKMPSPREGRTLRGRGNSVGKRAKVVTSISRGRYVWYELPKEKPWDIALVPSIRAAAPYQQVRKSPGMSVVINPQDVRIKIREYRAPFSIILLVDMSMSMGISLYNLSRAIRTLHSHVYRRRDRVGLIVFKGSDAFVLQEPTTNLDLAMRRLWNVGTSDLTPMASGMFKAWKVLNLEKKRNQDSIPMLIVISDGIVNIPLRQPLSTYSRMRLQSESQADVMDVARLLSRDKLRTVIVNTSHSSAESDLNKNYGLSSDRKLYTPTEFLMELSKVTNGSYYGLTLSSGNEIPIKTKKRRLDDWFRFDNEVEIA